ncbi:MAG TPA: hypothetical protein VEP28_08285 [Rubrobacter sp.]|nr:hypothetical protein [Rubrobacter sp.]
MKDNENRILAIERVGGLSYRSVDAVAGNRLALESTARRTRGPVFRGLTSEQRAVLERIEAALEAHRHYFYPMVTAKKVVTLAHGAGERARRCVLVATYYI